MAQLPQYGRVTRPVGPGPLMPPGPIYDVGLRAWGNLLGQAGAEYAARDQSLRNAAITTAASEQTAKFSLGLQGALMRAQELRVGPEGQERLATPQEQEGFFRQESQRLLDSLDPLDQADPETRARYRAHLESEMTSAVGKLKSEQRRREIANIADRLQYTRQAALVSGNQAVFAEALSEAAAAGVITAETYKNELASFPVESAMAQSLAVMHRNPQEVIDRMTAVLDRDDLTSSQRERAISLLSRGQNAQKGMEDDIEELREKQYQAARSEIRSAIDAGDPDVMAKINASPLSDLDKADMTRQYANRYSRTDTDHRVMVDLQGQVLDVMTGDAMAVKVADSKVKARYTDQKLSQEAYEQLQNMPQLAPATARDVKGALERQRWRFVDPKLRAEFTDDIVRWVAAAGDKPPTAAEIDRMAREMVAARLSESRQRAYREYTGVGGRTETEAEKLERQLTRSDDRSVDEIISFPRDEQQAALAQKLVDIRQREGTGGNAINRRPEASARDKGPGFLGELKAADDYTSTELSIGVEFDGQETEIPTLVPTLTVSEVVSLLRGEPPTEAIVDKAVEHARKRMREGKDPFAGDGERQWPEPETVADFETMVRLFVSDADARAYYDRWKGKF